MPNIDRWAITVSGND